MTTTIDTRDVCCAALELSKTSWVCAFFVEEGVVPEGATLKV
jgi:hypothetical protein